MTRLPLTVALSEYDQVADLMNGRVEAEGLDAWCRGSRLADYKRPRDYIFVAEIPKSPVGKILRRLLVAGDYRRE